jgi:hypothetical protein
MAVLSRTLGDGARNVQVLVTGVLERDCEPTAILDLDTLKATPAVKVTSALWIVQEKMGLRLWWGTSEELTPENLIFIAESRNAVRFQDGLASPRNTDKWDRKIWMAGYGFDSTLCTPKCFTLLLDLDKQ